MNKFLVGFTEESLTRQIANMTGPDRNVDAKLADVFRTYLFRNLADALSDSNGVSVIKSVTYRPFYDNVAVKVGLPDRPGGLVYSEKLPAFTASADEAKKLLPKNEPWHMTFGVRGYGEIGIPESYDQYFFLKIRAREVAAPTEALAVCLAVAMLNGV